MILKEAGKGSVEDENPGTDIKVRGILNSRRVMSIATNISEERDAYKLSQYNARVYPEERGSKVSRNTDSRLQE
jgi:hypothetical protein